ncbi:(p)ppGpp synthetase [Microvirga sp. 3-52]|nr:(p)ppGpp synthetase [Microvirga sp. 3-52]MBS7452573.1 (p)ppGpp synthetase [Microvirga sp. 3-52]
MASLDYETEKNAFREYYESNRAIIDGARKSFITLISSLLSSESVISVSKVEGRVKDREECLGKFNRKYRKRLEDEKAPYTIREHITDLIGLRIVCLYEDDVERVRELISQEFEVMSVTDKISQIENTEGSFGYKGLHLDLRLSGGRKALKEYAIYADHPFELQIRTVVQDSWSILDHKIKYKKSIPNGLKRRINTLAALFELADREFRAIRDSTSEEIDRENSDYDQIDQESEAVGAELHEAREIPPRRHAPLNAFSFLRIAGHFFPNHEFEAHKVDGFTKEIVDLKPDITRGKFNFYLRGTISEVKRYQAEFERTNEGETLNPYTVIRHCLYAGDKEVFASMLTDVARESFEAWRQRN